MLWNMINVALREIKRNLLRSILTVLGIVIGVSSVITMVTVGNGATEQVKQQIASMGSNILMITPGKRFGPGQAGGTIQFKEIDMQAIKNEILSVENVTPVTNDSLIAVYGNQNWTTQVTGTDNNYFKVSNRIIKEGRLFSDSEIRSGTSVCIIGETVKIKLFGGQNALGERIRIGKLSCEVIGLLEAKGQSAMGTDQDDIIIIPLRTFQRRISGSQDIAMIMVSIKKDISTEKAQQDIRELMRERRHLSQNEDDNFTIMDMKEISKMLTETTRLLTALLGAVAAVSLLVGGIGIMNIMLVSVTERTREIGIRLAIGAIERDILIQFLVEATVLSSSGGLLGIFIALIASFLVCNFIQVPFNFNVGINLISFLFSAFVGIVFGFFPAKKAARLDPMIALRNE
ncbi:ABC transporter permease [Thermodesulfovibrio yellowstonii]|uniref:Permease protein of ABC transporter n=3 Tax=Thermodesulfovibrio yellowstonii TaxID=28262 RepID=B5YG11_THEYD|nr:MULTISPECIES: ABC transporter permease [Thermodesulfovibrio]ACI21204.1 permease protein of ABC transporter [Thermodesulfovibrio yellowstonii DSM 11347]GLI53199.1 ABC transporter permease [Thermodesulfovibrio islandicus]